MSDDGETAGDLGGGAEDRASAGSMREIGGSDVDAFNALIARQVTGALYVSADSAADRGAKAVAALAALVSIAPRCELEGMLAAQMVACHSAAMECFRRAAQPGQISEVRGENLMQAARLSRAYASLVEALDRRRGEGGRRTVTVEHRIIRGDGGLDVSGVPRIAAPHTHTPAQRAQAPRTRARALRKGIGHAENGHAVAGGASLLRALETDDAALSCAGGSGI